MTPDYKQLLNDYPEYMSLDQMRTVCHISKKTARLLLQTGLIPYKNTGKKTHTYLIKKTAVIKYLKERDKKPEKYILLKDRPLQEFLTDVSDGETQKRDEIKSFDEYPDVLSVQQAATLSGVTPKTVTAWAKAKLIKAFRKSNRYHIPKSALIEYISSPQHKRNFIREQNNKSKRQMTDTSQ